MNRGLRSSASWLFFAALSIGGVGCAKTSPNQGVPAGQAKAQILTGTALDTALTAAAKARGIPDASSQFLLANRQFSLALASPLFDDDQKFWLASGQYGPHVWAYGADGLDNDDTGTFATPQLVAALYVESAPPTGDLAYSTLALANPGNYCVFLKSGNPWTFATFYVGGASSSSPQLCSSIKPDNATWIKSVYVEQNAYSQGTEKWDRRDDYPGTVRFVEGTAGASGAGTKMFLAVPCGNQTCLLGAQKKGDAPDPNAPKGGRHRGVRLWHDDQHLEVGTMAALPASITPMSGLASLSLELLTGKTYVPVAIIYIPPNSSALPQSKYQQKLGLTEGVDTVFLQLNDAATGTAIIGNKNGRSQSAFAVKRDDHANLTGGKPIPAVARWRWVDGDEQIWVRCDVGCCMVDPSDSRPRADQPKPSSGS